MRFKLAMRSAKGHVRTCLILCLLCAACGGGRTEWPGDPELYGVDLVVEASAAFSPTPASMRHVMEGAAARWALLPPTAFAGLRIMLTGDTPNCGGRTVIGCYDEAENTATVSTLGAVCLEQTLLAHELLHYSLAVATGDADVHHADPRWDDLGGLNNLLAAEVGCLP